MATATSEAHDRARAFLDGIGETDPTPLVVKGSGPTAQITRPGDIDMDPTGAVALYAVMALVFVAGAVFGGAVIWWMVG